MVEPEKPKPKVTTPEKEPSTVRIKKNIGRPPKHNRQAVDLRILKRTKLEGLEVLQPWALILVEGETGKRLCAISEGYDELLPSHRFRRSHSDQDR